MADLCARAKGAGTSVFETSLGRDRVLEPARFRIVTLRPVVDALKMLTFPLGSSGREPHGDRYNRLLAALNTRFPDVKSPKGNGAAYWLTNCVWEERDSEAAVKNENLLHLIRQARPQALLPEFAESMLDELRDRAKTAGAARWEPDPERKKIGREALCEWWRRRRDELLSGQSSAAGTKLMTKMAAAGLPEDLARLAAELRIKYAAVARTSRYMDAGENERLQGRVRSAVQSLRSRFVAGQLAVDAAGFHARCLDEMDVINAGRPQGAEDRSAFLKGCMYDIADRCLLRFERLKA